MADIEKVYLGETSYDIRDVKAFHDKAYAGSYSLVEENSGTTQYPSNYQTNTYNVVLGYSAVLYHSAAKYNVVIGAAAKNFSTSASACSYTVSVGYNAQCSLAQSVAVGANAVSRQYGVSVGYGATTTQNYTVSVGSSANCQGGNSVAIGYSSRTAGYGDIAIGSSAQITVAGNSAIQLGSGTNTNGGFQVRNWQLLDNNGIIPIERIPKNAVVTTTDPLPDPNRLTVGTTQMYLGDDTDDFKKNHMYSVAVDRTKYRAFPMDYNPLSSSSPDFDPVRDVQIVDAEKLMYKITMSNSLHGGKPIDVTTTGMWNNRYVPVYYTGYTSTGVPQRMFYIGASYEQKTETLYYDYNNGPYITKEQLEDEWGIKVDWTRCVLPSYQSSVFYIVLSDKFYLYDYTPPTSTYFYTCAKFNYYDLAEWVSKPHDVAFTDGSTRPYTLKQGDQIQLTWFGNSSVDPSAGGAWWLMLKRAEDPADASPHHIQPPQDGQHSLYNYWTTDELKRDWGIMDVGTGLYGNRSALSGTKFRVGWEYGHKWVEASFDLKDVDGYSTTENQVLKNTNGYIQWGTGGSGGSEEDNVTITKNAQDKIQAVGLINKNTSSTDNVFDWVGTLAEYTSQNIETQHPDWICYITDDVRPTESGFPMWKGTAAQYEAITTKDPDTLYIITE